jgi:hypothetical protein
MEACLRMRLVVQERGNLERSVGRAAHFFQPDDTRPKPPCQIRD